MERASIARAHEDGGLLALALAAQRLAEAAARDAVGRVLLGA